MQEYGAYVIRLVELNSHNLHMETAFSSKAISQNCSNAVTMATAYGLDDQRVRVQAMVESRIFTSPYPLDLLKVPTSKLSDGY